MTKKNITIISLVTAVVLIGWDYIGNARLCTSEGVLHYDCFNTISSIELIFFPVFPLAFLSLLTYRMRDEIFRAWTSFAVWWVPLSMLAIIIAPEEIKGSISVPMKWPLAVFCAAILLLVSIIIILWKHYSLKKKNSN